MTLIHTACRTGRLSSFLLGEMRLSAGLMNKLKWGTAIRVNGCPQRTNYPVSPGDVIEVDLLEPLPEYPPEDGDIAILYEDDYLLAVDKPAGMLIHPSRGKNTGTLANLVWGYYQRSGQSCAYHPLTRLDRDTFGVVLLAKNAYTHALLQQTPVEKIYHALTFGGPEQEAGLIDVPIARRPLPSLLRYVDDSGKPSQTRYQVLHRDGPICHLALTPCTGRTHQLRVHCAYMGWPILGDPQYGSEESQALSLEWGLHHQQLCAKVLRLPHPVTGQPLVLESGMGVWQEK